MHTRQAALQFLGCGQRSLPSILSSLRKKNKHPLAEDLSCLQNAEDTLRMQLPRRLLHRVAVHLNRHCAAAAGMFMLIEGAACPVPAVLQKVAALVWLCT